MTLMPLSDKLIKELTVFGLTGNEAKVYLALLQLGKASARAIAKLSDIPRQEIYRVLPQLEELGIIEVINDKPTKFTPINPKRLFHSSSRTRKKCCRSRSPKCPKRRLLWETN